MLVQAARIYVPLPPEHNVKPPAVVMYKQPVAAPAPARVVQQPKPHVQKPKPVVQHRGIGMPPAQPGQCFAKVKTPAKFQNRVKRVQVSPAVNKRVLVRGPQYTWINKKVVARAATHRMKYVPATYRNVTKRILVKPAHYKWQRGKTGPITRIDNMTGEILCRVKVDAVYKTITQKVVATPARKVRQYIPAVYKTTKIKKLVSPAVYRTIQTPARFVNKNYRTKVSEERYSWKPIACKTQGAQAPKQVIKAAPRPPTVNPKVAAEQRRLAKEFDQQQKVLRQQWLVQEAERQRVAQAKQRQAAAQRRQAQQARQQQAQQRQAQLQRQRAAQQQADLAQQRRAAQILLGQHKQQAYAKPKQPTTYEKPVTQTPKPTMVSHSRTVQPVAPKPAVQRAAPVGDSAVTPLTRANAVYRIQKALQQRGYNPGEIDGRLGPSTVKALTAFQESKGLKTGTLDRDTLRALNLVQ